MQFKEDEMKLEKLVDCPKCDGWGFDRRTDKICPCCLEYSQGFTPGKLPLSIAIKIRNNYALQNR